ncbi:uncharacterized protein CTHT_0024160 [Thermochaetoides thermophila DSM 1495]|uniref:Uncharacterized protein n=1 Tax=Chaetomium thermophilum (strain DSM 1495 / CBS 144.50 / IMI 039719) TaxID=759272 RepID=G0S5A9_CHATD|nr:hypothetical protein CTHT_0024160 [Thermochaetoides thermophila DSM 1495]EGS20582.1 hypothetical protein CTHT_0024160 [Thermochaetoides thermophila DSM 1495]
MASRRPQSPPLDAFDWMSQDDYARMTQAQPAGNPQDDMGNWQFEGTAEAIFGSSKSPVKTSPFILADQEAKTKSPTTTTVPKQDSSSNPSKPVSPGGLLRQKSLGPGPSTHERWDDHPERLSHSHIQPRSSVNLGRTSSQKSTESAPAAAVNVFSLKGKGKAPLYAAPSSATTTTVSLTTTAVTATSTAEEKGMLARAKEKLFGAKGQQQDTSQTTKVIEVEHDHIRREVQISAETEEVRHSQEMGEEQDILDRLRRLEGMPPRKPSRSLRAPSSEQKDGKEKEKETNPELANRPLGRRSLGRRDVRPETGLSVDMDNDNGEETNVGAPGRSSYNETNTQGRSGYNGISTQRHSSYHGINTQLTVDETFVATSGRSGYDGINTQSRLGYNGVSKQIADEDAAVGMSGRSGYNGINAQGRSGYGSINTRGNDEAMPVGSSGRSGYNGINKQVSDQDTTIGTTGRSGYNGISIQGRSGYDGINIEGRSRHNGINRHVNNEEKAVGASGHSGYNGINTQGRSGYNGMHLHVEGNGVEEDIDVRPTGRSGYDSINKKVSDEEMAGGTSGRSGYNGIHLHVEANGVNNPNAAPSPGADAAGCSGYNGIHPQNRGRSGYNGIDKHRRATGDEVDVEGRSGYNLVNTQIVDDDTSVGESGRSGYNGIHRHPQESGRSGYNGISTQVTQNETSVDAFGRSGSNGEHPVQATNEEEEEVGIDGLTIVLHLRGKEDLVISADLRGEKHVA